MPDISKPNFSNALWASGGSVVAPSNTKIQTGWTAEVPPFQWENWSQNRQDQGIAHILQHGVSVWDSLTEYQANKSYVQGSDGVIYFARTTNTNINPTTDVNATNWIKPLSGGLIGVKTFGTAGSFNYVASPGTKRVRVTCVGGGGGAGGAPATDAANGSLGGAGGSGATAISLFESGFSGVQVIVGTGGTGGNGAGVPGSIGQASSFGTLMSAPGGVPGTSVPNVTVFVQQSANATQAPTGANILSSVGNRGTVGIILSATVGGPAAGGVSQLGGNIGRGGDGQINTASMASKVGLAGVAGIVIVEEFN